MPEPPRWTTELRHPVGSPAYRKAEQEERAALAAGRPVPRDVAALLMQADMAELEQARASAETAKARLYDRVLRQTELPEWIIDPQGRTSRDRLTGEERPMRIRHPDKMGYGEIGRLVHRHPSNVQTWVERWRARRQHRPTPEPPAQRPAPESVQTAV